MNCQECEKNIWINAELSEAERSQVENHTQTCSDCRRRYEEMVAVSQILKQATPIIPELKNAAALTSRIMDELPPKNQSWRALFLSSLDNTWVQNSLRFVSMVLVVLFVWESNPDSNQLTKHFPRGKTVVLNSIAFIKKYDEIRSTPKKVTFYQRYQKVKKSHI
ncbi:MAG: zf-HC2 domain-containing protein [Cyclobacteriaceae bacterium]|nr:zf-HC2 domain-containing protein [Cyclobacteriaceae bacterium]